MFGVRKRMKQWSTETRARERERGRQLQEPSRTDTKLWSTINEVGNLKFTFSFASFISIGNANNSCKAINAARRNYSLFRRTHRKDCKWAINKLNDKRKRTNERTTMTTTSEKKKLNQRKRIEWEKEKRISKEVERNKWHKWTQQPNESKSNDRRMWAKE